MRPKGQQPGGQITFLSLWDVLPTGTVGGGRISLEPLLAEGVAGGRPGSSGASYGPAWAEKGDGSRLRGMQARDPLEVSKELGVEDARAQSALSSA